MPAFTTCNKLSPRRAGPNIQREDVEQTLPLKIVRATAPVSHQKRGERSTTNAIEIKRKRSNINETDRYPAAHNGPVGGSGQLARW